MNYKKGVTLLEILISISVSMLIIFIIIRLSTTSSFINVLIDQTVKVRQGSDYIFQTLITDIRSMTVSSLGAYPIEAASSTGFIFYSDIDRDGLIEKVNYYLATSTLNKITIKPTGNPLVYASSSAINLEAISNVNISQSSFEYFNQSYTGIEMLLLSPIDPLVIRVIKIIIAVNTSSTPVNIVKFSNTVTPRNIKTN